MAIITRPNKTGGGTEYIAGNDVLAEEFNSDINTMYTDYGGNITNDNCSPIMGLKGTKLADAPSGVPEAKLNTDSVITRTIKDNSVTLAKLKNVVVEDINLTFTSILAGVWYTVSHVIKNVAGNYKLDVFGYNTSGGQLITLTPITNIPVATKHIISAECVITANPMGTTNVAPIGYIRVISVDKT